MKLCFFGYDHSIDVLVRLMEDGHEALQVYTFECDNFFSFNRETKLFCEKHHIPVIEGKITPDDTEALLNKGCELFLSVGYPFKIPPIDEKRAYSVNIHPTLLPRARGIMPQPFIIYTEPEASGFTIHKHTQEYDAGDILFQKAIPVEENTDIETLAARIAVHTPPAISMVLKDIEQYYANAIPQDHSKASYYDEPDAFFRTLQWSDTVENLLHKGRAFGRFGVVAQISSKFGESQQLAVFQFSGWVEKHNLEPGTLVRSFPREITIAVQNGYICLKEFQNM